METITANAANVNRAYLKPKRTIRPRVLKSEYDKLHNKYKWLRWIALAGWLAFAIALGSCTPVVINGVRVNQKASTKIDPETKFYGTAAFLIGAGITTHFYHREHK